MAKALDYDKFFDTAGSKSGEVIKTVTKSTPPEVEGLQKVLKDFNQTLGLVNSTLGTLGIDSSIFKDKVKEKFGMGQQRQQPAQMPYVETFRTPPQQIEKKEEIEIENKMNIDIEKIKSVIDLVIKFKGDDMKLSELKTFVEENENIITGLLK